MVRTASSEVSSPEEALQMEEEAEEVLGSGKRGRGEEGEETSGKDINGDVLMGSLIDDTRFVVFIILI